MASFLQLMVLLMCVIEGHSTPIGSDSCVVDGKVYANGDVFIKKDDDTPCIEYKCHSGGYKIHKKECLDKEGNCRTKGTKETANCVTRECLDGDSGTIFYIQEKKCSDADNKCHKPGEIFPHVLNGILHHNCTCRLDGSKAIYSC